MLKRDPTLMALENLYDGSDAFKGAVARRRLAMMLGPQNDYQPSLIATAKLFEERARLASKKPSRG